MLNTSLFQEDGMLNTSAESGGRRSSAGGGARKKSLKGQGHGKPKAYKLGETAPMNVSSYVLLYFLESY